MPSDADRETLIVDGREIAISNPRKILFPDAGYTKLDLARYYVAVSRGALRAAGGRPNVLVRYPNGVAGDWIGAGVGSAGRPGSRRRTIRSSDGCSPLPTLLSA